MPKLEYLNVSSTSIVSNAVYLWIAILGKFWGQIRAHVCEDFAGKQE